MGHQYQVTKFEMNFNIRHSPRSWIWVRGVFDDQICIQWRTADFPHEGYAGPLNFTWTYI